MARTSHTDEAGPRRYLRVFLRTAVAGLVMAGTGCATRPFGADRVSPEVVYKQIDENALTAGRPSATTVSLLHQYQLAALAKRRPDQAVRALHEKVADNPAREGLFALADLSYVAGESIRGSLKSWDPRDAHAFYLGSAVYAYLYLFGEEYGPEPDPFDRRFRVACDLYNFGLGIGLTRSRGTNVVVDLEPGRRALPVGEIHLGLDTSHFPFPMQVADAFLMADQFRVRGLSVRSRDPGLGTPLIAVGGVDENLRLRRAFPATVFMRLSSSLAELSGTGGRGNLELYAGYDDDPIDVEGREVPLERDLTAPAALVLNQSFAWKVQRLQFLKPGEGLKSQLICSEPYQFGKIPLVFVHGTFSSPVWWAEMVNALRNDPDIRKRYQIWQFLYSSSKPIVVSASELRDAMTAQIETFDPQGQDAALREVVLVGHSQGGLLCKLCVTDTGDKIWRVFSDKEPEELNLTTEQVAAVRRYAYFSPLPFVRRAIFIGTPHRGSFLASNFARNLIRRLITAPASLAERSKSWIVPTEGVRLPRVMANNKMPTSLDSMSPENPLLLALAKIPPAPGIFVHSIIPIDGDEEPPDGDDGVVAYESAHVDYGASEFIVRSRHSCQHTPECIEEVRRILHEHLASQPNVAR
jgi:pimeloyl-ACP methyl ester carboxylesterase